MSSGFRDRRHGVGWTSEAALRLQGGTHRGLAKDRILSWVLVGYTQAEHLAAGSLYSEAVLYCLVLPNVCAWGGPARITRNTLPAGA